MTLQISFPIRASIIITNRCNYHCTHCYTNAGDQKFDELNTKQWKKIMDELESNGIFELYVGGGEPFVRKDIIEILNYSTHKKKFTTTTSTDGALITNNNVKLIDESINIQVSLDGNKKSHELIRGQNSYEQTIRGLKKLLEIRKNVGVGTVVNKINLNDLEEIHTFLIQNQVKSWHIMRVQPAGRALAIWNLLSISNKEWVDIVNLLNILKQKKNSPYIFINGTFDIEDIRKIEPENRRLYFASESGREICILPNGDVVPNDISFGLEKYVLGNVLEKKIETIWEESKLFEKFFLITEKINGKCNDCSLFETCRGGSRLVAEVLLNDVYAPDPYCPHDPPNNFVEYVK